MLTSAWVRWTMASRTALVPMVGIVVLAATWGSDIGVGVELAVTVVLAGCVLAAVQHAEVVAHRVGEPFGSLILAVAVTVIEVGLIVTLMVSGGPETDALARDTVFAAAMITCNGIAGLALFIGAIRFGTTHFNSEGAGAALATVATWRRPAWCCRPSPPARRGRSSRRRSWPSPRWRRWCST